MITSVEALDVNAFHGAAVAATDNGVIIGVNQLAEEVFGYKEAELLGQNLRMLMPKAVASHHDAFLEHYRKHRSRRLIGKARRVSILRKDGTKTEYTLRLGEYMEGSTLRFVGVFTQDDPDTCATDLSEFTEASTSFSEMSLLKSSSFSSVRSTVDSVGSDASEVPLSLPLHASAIERAAFNAHSLFVSGFLKQKLSAGRWKSQWVVLDHSSKKLSIFSASKGLKNITGLCEVRPLGTPSRELNIMDCSIRDGSGITGKPGTISICQKGDNVRHFLCPSAAVALLWIETLKVRLFFANNHLILSRPLFILVYCVCLYCGSFLCSHGYSLQLRKAYATKQSTHAVYSNTP